MSDINVTVQDEIVEIDVIDTPVYVDVINSPGAAGPAGPGVAVGGTAGQILAKASATNYDTEWINNYAKYLATNVRNQTGSTIAAFRVVYISGATGNKPLVSLADADTEATSSKTYGVTAVSIANNGTGDVVTAGELSGIDTSAFNEGDSLWLSSTAGQVQTTPPAEPAHTVFIGTVVRSHPTLGVVDVAIQNGYELTELHGVEITAPANNDGLFYNGSLWVNKSIPTALGYTPANAATTLTINGVSYDLSANRSWTISAGISGSGASGQVTYWTGASAVSGSNNLFWDAANNVLAIGTNTPNIASIFHANKSQDTLTSIFVTNSSAGTAAHVGFRAGLNPSNFGTDYVTMFILGTNYGTAGSLKAKSGVIECFGSNFVISNYNNSEPISFATGTSRVEKMRLFANGNVLIQNGGTFTDNGARLQVSGNVTIQGSGGNVFFVTSSGGSNLFYIQNAGNIGFTAYNWIPEATAAGVIFDASNARNWNVAGNAKTATSGVSSPFLVTTGYAPTSGTGVYNALTINPTINQTGGANGITRGLYVNPTLTSAADFRAIETSAGNVLFGSNFFWDNTNSRLGIGTNAPSQKLVVVGNSFFGAIVGVGHATGNAGEIQFFNGNVFIRRSGASGLEFGVGSATVVQTIFSTGNVLIQNGGTFTDNGARLQVSGTSTFSDNLSITKSFNGSTLLTLTNSTSGASSNAYYRAVSSNGYIDFGRTSASSTAYKIISANNSFIANGTAGDIAILNDVATGTIKMAAGASSTSHLTIKANGTINMSSLPTSSTGLVAGDLWNNGGVINIV